MAKKIIAYTLSEYLDRDGKERTRWRRAGVAFENDREEQPGDVGKNGGSITVLLDAIPLDLFQKGELRIQLRADDEDRRDSRRDDRRGADRGRR